MDVSIIVVNYNTKELTVNCLRSVYASKTQYSYEVILVDNASSDGSVEAIRNAFPDVTIIDNSKNVGFGRANNQAAKLSTGRYLYVLNSDTEIEEDVIEKVIAYGDANPDASIIGNRTVYPDGRIQESVYKFPTLLSEIIFFTISIIKSKNMFIFNLNKYQDYQTRGPFEVDVIAGFSMFVKREVYEKIGLFNDNIFMYYEDDEFCCRAKLAGFKRVYYPLASIKHIHRGSAKKHEKNHEMIVTCFKSACIYFNAAKSSFHVTVFKGVCALAWYAEMSILGLLSLFLKEKKLDRKIGMLKALLK